MAMAGKADLGSAANMVLMVACFQTGHLEADKRSHQIYPSFWIDEGGVDL